MNETKFTISADWEVANKLRQITDPRAQLYYNELEGGWQMTRNGRYGEERVPAEQIWVEYERRMEGE
jgi:hypothetical protein